MTKLAQLIAQEEGFNVPGSVPNRDNNPGDLRHSPHSFHTAGDPDGIGIISTVADGWEDLERQLQLYASRNLTLEQMVYEFAPPSENNSAEYLAFVCSGLKCDPQMLVSDALKIT
jgi:hypothetical protein